MKWIELNGKKDPEFNKDYVLLNTLDAWNKGYLKEKIETNKGKQYSFYIYLSGEIVHDITHFMIIELPKNNQ